ncbi:hypothetical protein CHLNCDRAFT_55134 [Chlorella variabilis]|uniref:K+ potassium transporter integral membrane domain-containing protein n=1 Tax=Chlorella variabilis TaxID=554065 RepID=E1ZRY0_CHLVA|nr:hypothetical protein CHLNCDRAFT_55134 [Chlorella variabilis]EFN51417.1 hypothetical protein CHLNCDRAFT_55134 [Chlorella variabilis]|eukprot:XP_005843519.1 hypothetical protein CHLNCDRAFT_55134 [Chlorella variabilis]
MAGQLTVSSLWAHDADLQKQVEEAHRKRMGVGTWSLLAMAFSTLGIVYGDIGTSPLYVFASIFPDGPPSAEVTLGAASTIFWSITGIVVVKYIVFTLQADDNGEGGIFALYALLCRAVSIRSGSLLHEADLSLSQYQAPDPPAQARASPSPPHTSGAGTCGGPGAAYTRWRQSVVARARASLEGSRAAQGILLAVVLLAANMILSDGVLTPAISVVSAVEGIEYQTGISRGTVVGIAVGILVCLFAVQPWGTQRVAVMFSPLVFLWFASLSGIGEALGLAA